MSNVHDDKIRELEERANLVRQDIIRSLEHAGSGHSAGSLDMADVFTAMYFHILKHDPQRPLWEERDRLLLSAGHICPVRYVAMAHAGYFPVEELMTLRQFGSRLQGHPERDRLPALENTSGPLGAGLAQAGGIAYAARMDGRRFQTYCVTSDAEHDAGLHWEAVFFAGRNGLGNLTCIVDRNIIQIDGSTEDIMPLDPLGAKYEAFNWHVIEIDGHNMRQIIDATDEAKAIRERPTVIVAHTVPGKGVDFMEGDYEWHGKPPNAAEAEQALAQLHEQLEAIRAGR